MMTTKPFANQTVVCLEPGNLLTMLVSCRGLGLSSALKTATSTSHTHPSVHYIAFNYTYFTIFSSGVPTISYNFDQFRPGSHPKIVIFASTIPCFSACFGLPHGTLHRFRPPGGWISKAMAGSSTALYLGSRQYLEIHGRKWEQLGIGTTKSPCIRYRAS